MAASDVPPTFQLDLQGFLEDDDVLDVYNDVLVPEEREDVLKNYIHGNLNQETQKKTKREVAALEKWLKTQKEPRPLEEIEPEVLNLLLGLYIIGVKRQDGGLYEPSSLASIFSSVKRYLQQKDYPENVITSEKFKQARDSLATRKKELKAQGMGNQPNKVSIPVGGGGGEPSLPFTIFRSFGGEKKTKKTPSLPFTIFRSFGGERKKKNAQSAFHDF